MTANYTDDGVILF